MEISPIKRTCSMVELGRVFNTFISKVTKHAIEKRILEYKIHSGIYYQIRCVLFNTNANLNIFARIALYLQSGFKRVYSYKGNSGRVYVYMAKVNI